MTRFLWFDINASYSHSSLAIPALHAQIPGELLRRSRWKAVSGTLKSDPGQLLSEALSFRPHYVLATVWLFNAGMLTGLLCRLKALRPGVRIVLGGPEFLGDNALFLKQNRFADAVFRGEGEEVFPRFVRAAVQGGPEETRPWEDLPGFEYLLPDGAYHRSPVVTVQDFAALVPAERSRFFRWDKSFVQLETSRGCFNTCRFCVSGIDRTPVRNIAPEAVRRRLERIARKGIREVRILDRTFNGQPRRAVQLLEIFRRFAGRIRFHVEIHPALINDTFADYLSSLPEGLLHIEAGLQSLEGRVIRKCRRYGDARQALDGLEKLLSVKKFEIHTDLIAGLPGYTFRQLLQDVNRLIQAGPHEIQLESLKLLPGTHFRENAREHGILHSPVPPYEVLETKSIDYNQLKDCMILSKVLDRWYNDPRWRDLFRRIVAAHPDFSESLVRSLSETGTAAQPAGMETAAEWLYGHCKEHYPSVLGIISAGWVRNGLSLKKEPAAALRPWIRPADTAPGIGAEEFRGTAETQTKTNKDKDSDKNEGDDNAGRRLQAKGSPAPQPGDTGPDNPFRVRTDTKFRYYYLIENDNIHWYCFNKELNRNLPVEYACQKYRPV